MPASDPGIQGQAPSGRITWEDLVLQDLGAPVTAASEAFLQVWERSEGGVSVEHINNPLNTTLDRAKYPGYPAAPKIPMYPNLVVGAQETADTLKAGYPTITRALRTDKVKQLYFDPAFVGDLNKWVSGRYSTQPSKYTGQIAANYAASGFAAEASASDWTSVDLGSVAGAAGSAASSVWNAVDAVPRALAFIFSYRFLEIIGGGFLILLGLYIISRQFGKEVGIDVPGVSEIVKAAATNGAAGAA